ncbi:putative C6 transcription factor [Aspergillus novofumigatus IBT 16806]|uniref:Putative C6 transcription factor n=1 Tax=Aspergillus novofumigatus (strain IBT 16806) TaxID=1392255 RepID=A0A2I1CFS9_ASPN1|nr:putative C6 transcription factor [Aspergillus novofumigatus IBT 16806]PKX96448.1 putative C6 transcription factor [Aspergillus novofumigatus IBT 16806]
MDDPETAPVPNTWPNARDEDSRPRKRRRKYITKACNECKRRKIKCNGQSPCQRCGRQQIDCVYAGRTRPDQSDQQRNMSRLIEQMSAMQEQISALSAAVYALSRAGNSPQDQGRVFRRPSSARELTFQGPTTSAFSFGLAKSSLQRRGIVDGDGDEAGEEGEERDATPPTRDDTPLGMLNDDSLWTISKAEAIRLCRVYGEEMGIMYPVLELEELLRQVESLYGLSPRLLLRSGDYDVHILRLVFACALTAEASGRSELAMRLFESVRDVADDCVWGPPDIDRIIFLTLVAIFYFQMDEEALAWRTIGLVERMCLEKGLHRCETLSHPTVVAAGRDRVLRLFWSIYTLDMRWSFGTGMPFSLEDSDIDPWLPEPEEKTPYLRVMIRYSRIAAKVWKFISAFNNTGELKKDEMNYLDWQVLQWAAAIPASLRLGDDSPDKEPRSIRRLRSLLYLRANQLRMLIHRPVLHSAGHIVRYPADCETAVDLAKDTIRFITRLNETSDIYQLQQVAFNWFLVSALAVLFLAVVQAPSQFSSRCKEEFYMALELVKGFSTQSYISRRLWKSIKSLRKLGPQVGLRQSASDQRVLAANRTVDMAPASNQGQTPQDGAQMTQELMEWFEAVGTLENQIMGVTQVFDDGSGRMANGYMYDYGGDLSSVMRDLF